MTDHNITLDSWAEVTDHNVTLDSWVEDGALITVAACDCGWVSLPKDSRNHRLAAAAGDVHINATGRSDD